MCAAPLAAAVACVNLVARDLDILNKRRDVSTTFSDRGARWMASVTGRWLTPDPMVTSPSDKQLKASSPTEIRPHRSTSRRTSAGLPSSGCGGSRAVRSYRSSTSRRSRRPPHAQTHLAPVKTASTGWSRHRHERRFVRHPRRRFRVATSGSTTLRTRRHVTGTRIDRVHSRTRRDDLFAVTVAVARASAASSPRASSRVVGRSDATSTPIATSMCADTDRNEGIGR